MPEFDPQQLTRIPHNEPLTHVVVQKLKWLILNSLVGGNGIRVTRNGESVVVSLATQGRGFDFGGGESLPSGADYFAAVYVADSKANLPDASTVPVGSRGRVDGVGSDNGMECVVNPDKDGWDATNFWEGS